jgi:hypothetical protein
MILLSMIGRWLRAHHRQNRLIEGSTDRDPKAL